MKSNIDYLSWVLSNDRYLYEVILELRFPRDGVLFSTIFFINSSFLICYYKSWASGSELSSLFKAWLIFCILVSSLFLLYYSSSSVMRLNWERAWYSSILIFSFNLAFSALMLTLASVIRWFSRRFLKNSYCSASLAS